MQWASAHIHLAEYHDHGGIHYHAVESHAHDFTGHYSDATESSQLTETLSTIELDNQCNAPSGHNKHPDLATIPNYFQQDTCLQSVRLEQPFTETLFYHSLDQSAANPRAPPYFS